MFEIEKENEDDGRRNDDGNGRRGSNAVDRSVSAFGHCGVCKIPFLSQKVDFNTCTLQENAVL